MPSWSQLMLDQELCKNCLEPLCQAPHKRAPGRKWRGCLRHQFALAHHIDGTPANEVCTRRKVVMVKGCYGCFFADQVCGADSSNDYTLSGRGSNILFWWYGGILKITDREPRPKWCPLTNDKDQPDAGITLIAEIPAKEEG